MPTLFSKADSLPGTGFAAAPRLTAGRGRLRLALQAAAVLALCSGVVLLTGIWAGDLFLQQTEARAKAKLDLYASNLAGALGKYQTVPRLLALHSDVVEIFRAADAPQNQARANYLTATVNTLIGAEDTYLMDATGLTFAASNWESERPFVGHNFSFRPYFQQAMEGRLGRYFALGTTSGKRGYYFASRVSAPLPGGGTQALGVVVVKVSLDDVEAAWTASDEDVIVTDPHGVVFMSSRPEWRFRSLSPLNAEALRDLAENRRYEAMDLRPLDLERQAAGPEAPQILAIKGDEGSGGAAEYVMVAKDMPEAGWTLRVLASTDLARSQTVTAMVVAALACALTVLLATVLIQRRARLVERIEYQRRASEELEQRVEERTADLTEANARLEREIAERQAAEADLRQAQDDLIQAGKLAALGQMSAALSHEFNQPLAAIRSYADNAQLLIERNREAEACGNLKLIKDLTARMAEISKHLMTFARKPRSELRPVLLAEVLDDTLDFLRIRLEGSGVAVEVTQPDRGLTVLAGRVRLQHVILNLVSNALDALQGGTDPRIEIAVMEAGDRIALQLRDHGLGIPVDHIARIFDPFFTTKDVGEGLGLGLSISYNIVKDFDGLLRAENHPEGGAVFTIELPLLPAPARRNETLKVPA